MILKVEANDDGGNFEPSDPHIDTNEWGGTDKLGSFQKRESG